MVILPGEDATLLVVDAQTRLLPAIHDGASVLSACRRLVAGAARLGVPIVAFAHCPDKLGPLVPRLALPADTEVIEKRDFGGTLPGGRTGRFVVCGMEAHVCVLQTVLKLLAGGATIHLVVDAIGSRHPLDRDTAIRRLEREGALPVTVESVLFEWLGHADHPAFKDILAIVKEG